MEPKEDLSENSEIFTCSIRWGQIHVLVGKEVRRDRSTHSWEGW